MSLDPVQRRRSELATLSATHDDGSAWSPTRTWPLLQDWWTCLATLNAAAPDPQAFPRISTRAHSDDAAARPACCDAGPACRRLRA